jgi:hypothetical protein
MRRYVLLSYCMAMRTVSFRVKKRFPDLQHLVDAGLMREDELKVSSHLLSSTQCCGSGSADPCLCLVDPDADPDPSIFIIDLQQKN